VRSRRRTTDDRQHKYGTAKDTEDREGLYGFGFALWALRYNGRALFLRKGDRVWTGARAV
jgi:hypothetical protein